MVGEKINIQKEIEEILEREFKIMLEENANNPLFELIRSGRIKKMSLDEIKKEVLGV